MLYVTGTNENSTDYTEVFNPMSTTKCNRLADFPVPEIHLSVGNVIDEVPIVCGGQTKSRVPSRECYKYDLSQNEWVHLADMDIARAYHAAVVMPYSNRLWITGGFDWKSFELRNSTLFLSSNGSITAGPDLPKEIMNHCMVQLIDGRIMITGGSVQGYITVDEVIIYDPKSQNYTEGVNMRNTHEGHACALFFSRMHSGRPVVATIGGWLMDKTDNRGRSVELLDYTTPGAIWEESKNITSN